MLLMDTRQVFVTLTFGGLEPFLTFTWVLKRLGIDVFQNRSHARFDKFAQLTALFKYMIDSWADLTDVFDRALGFMNPRLSVDVCFIEKSNLSF